MNKPDGGPAFTQRSSFVGRYPGMTLRDWFAGQALSGLVDKYDPEMPLLAIAQEAYQMADAMIAEKEKK